MKPKLIAFAIPLEESRRFICFVIKTINSWAMLWSSMHYTFVSYRYRDQLNYEMAMEGLQDLPIYNDTVIKVENPDPKWPGFPQRVSVISSRHLKIT
jgi:hypothetical protein